MPTIATAFPNRSFAAGGSLPTVLATGTVVTDPEETAIRAAADIAGVEIIDYAGPTEQADSAMTAVRGWVRSLISGMKGVANGLAPLGADGKVPSANLPPGGGGGSGAVDSVNGATGVVVLDAADVGADAAGDADAAQAFAIQRSNHTGSQASSTISDFAEAVQDLVASTLIGSGVTVTYDDAAGTVTLAAAGSTDLEAVRDAIGVALVGVGLVSVTVDDAANTITIATTATANDTDANLKARANHTGTQSADTVTDGTTNKAYSATEKTKLAGIATGATANATDAQLRDRSTHTGTQTSSTISDFTEAAQDAVAAALSGVTGATVTYNDAAGTITITGLGDPETMRDVLGTALVGVGVISVTVNDAADTITISSTATANDTDANLKNRANHTGTQLMSTISDLLTGTATFTNKRITKRRDTVASTATLTIDSDSFDGAKVTALAAAMNIANPTGTPTGFQSLIIRIKDNGTARVLTYGTQWRAIGVTLPTTTVVNKTLYIGAQWNTDDSKWDVIAVAQEA